MSSSTQWADESELEEERQLPTNPVQEKTLDADPVQETHTESKRPCLYYQKGKCVFGEHCDMLHEDVNRRRIPICKYFLQNACSYGENCLYRHENRHEKENPKHKQTKGWRTT